MKIAYMTQWFAPEPHVKGLPFAQALHDNGCDVRVITGFPNYPGGKIYSGYKVRLFQREVMGDVTVDRVPLYPSHDRSRIGRILNYVSFACSLFIYSLFKLDRRDAIYIHFPPVTASVAGVCIGFLRRCPVIVEVQDLWPDTLAATGMVSAGWMLSLVGYACRFVYWRATRIIVQSHGFKRALVARGVPEGKIDVILNWGNETGRGGASGKLDLTPYQLAGHFNAVYAGNLGLAQGLDVILDAAKLTAAVDPTIQYNVVGDGPDGDRLRRRVADEGITNLRIFPRIDMQEVNGLLNAADVLLVTLKADPLFDITIPSKTQAYLAVGKPMIMSCKGEAAELVVAAGAGVSVPPGDAEALSKAILHLAALPKDDLADMGRTGKDYYDRNLAFSVGIKKTLISLSRATTSDFEPDAVRRIAS